MKIPYKRISPIDLKYKLQLLIMRIPIFEEIVIKKFDLISLTKYLSQKKISNGPQYINLSHISTALVTEAIDNIATALEKLSINPEFPYPIYVVTDAINSHPKLQVAHSVEELPAHFIRKVKRLKNKELAILNKAMLLSEKLSNQDISLRRKELADSYGPQKELYNNCREINFYQFILNKLSSTTLKD